jgi:hypothetical protein
VHFPLTFASSVFVPASTMPEIAIFAPLAVARYRRVAAT